MPIRSKKKLKNPIIPAVLEPNLLQIKKRIKQVENIADRVQIDVADGKFVKNKTFLDLWQLVSIKTLVGFDIHLMVKNPLLFIDSLIVQKKVQRIIIHIELFKKESEFFSVVQKVTSSKKQLGIAINPDTPVVKLRDFLGSVDYILFLTVYPGWQGRRFENKVLKKIQHFRKKYKYGIIGVDGGINDRNILLCKKAGADEFCVGSFLFQDENIIERFKMLQKLIKS